MGVHHCPYCELRFQFAAEVKDHVIHDHPKHADAFAGVAAPELPKNYSKPPIS